ncbi:hypothetical protein DTO021D3_5195 [Paecilomyces variotii]|nr:hypothetical protein DTO032I3_6236 [Paecilomyces variotii]KAJ9277871.1 hypothetical protein DTO021D3_5195 [Paecilomyces variotii]KAJ9341534.1 hypothetical protein DTO027B6_5898 [Paecilomyces variotii]KAJ9379122.1 hypothetical protein DTO032I4_7379 [Paecilomyces variotii]
MAATISRRLGQATGFLTGGNQSSEQLPWNPDATRFPTRKELPKIPGAPEGAAWVWGKDDQIGRLNLLTPKRVKAASAEIKTGEVVPLNLPLNTPETPAFGREKFVHKIKVLVDNVCYDDQYELNTQSGTQWDGFRHFAHMPTQTFYNGAKGTDIVGPTANHKCSIHHWAEHGIAGRGILLDYWGYSKANGINYDPYKSHGISFADLQKCGQAQGIDIRPEAQGGDIKVGDILFIRSGFVEQYHKLTPEERTAGALRPMHLESDDKDASKAAEQDPHSPELEWAGLKQEEAIIDWLHDCYFAGVVGDAPSFEVWPTAQPYYLHEYILSLWGMPLGEMWDLERLTKKARELKRWSFFVTSAPANTPGGVSSHANATAIF